MTHISPPGKKNNRSSLLSPENNYRHANGGAKTLTIKKLKSVYKLYVGLYDMKDPFLKQFTLLSHFAVRSQT